MTALAWCGHACGRVVRIPCRRITRPSVTRGFERLQIVLGDCQNRLVARTVVVQHPGLLRRVTCVTDHVQVIPHRYTRACDGASSIRRRALGLPRIATPSLRTRFRSTCSASSSPTRVRAARSRRCASCSGSTSRRSRDSRPLCTTWTSRTRFGAPETAMVGAVIDGLQLSHADDHALLEQGCRSLRRYSERSNKRHGRLGRACWQLPRGRTGRGVVRRRDRGASRRSHACADVDGPRHA